MQKKKLSTQQKSLGSYMLGFIIFALFFFSLFKDRVWDYYLVGIPITFTLIFTLYASVISNKLYRNKIIPILIISIIVFNLSLGMFKKFDEKTATDGGAYINAKRIMDDLVVQKPTNYSLYVFSPAIFDPPFDYLIYWYNKKGLLEQPQIGKSDFYLIIREYSSKKYLNTGWYGDKTRDKSVVINHKKFTGDIILEQHTFK